MSRADMFVNPVREDWMTDELIQKLKAVSRTAKSPAPPPSSLPATTALP